MENIIIKNILTKDQIDQIYKIIDNVPEKNTTIQKRLGQKAYQVSLGEELRKHLESIVQNRYGNDWILISYQFARYSTKFGYRPKLFPHFDQTFDSHRLTLDVQVKSTIEWPIIVEGKEFILQDSDGLIFSGTDQIHWRSEIDLSETDVVDLIFCHCERKDGPNKKISKDHKEMMIIRQNEWQNKVSISNELEFFNLRDSV